MMEEMPERSPVRTYIVSWVFDVVKAFSLFRVGMELEFTG